MGQSIAIQSIIKNKNSLFTEVLLVAVTCVISVWYMRFLWKRRKLYRTSSKLPGPFALPLIGSAHCFIGKTTANFFDQLSHLFTHYPGLFKVWFGTRLFYAVSDPKYFEILLSSPHVLRKGYFYSMAEPLTGLGLLIAPVDIWKKHRKIIMPTFNQKILDQFMEVFVEQSEVLVQVMEKYTGKGEVDIFNLISRCTLDIICETAMGVQIKAQSTYSNFPKWVDRSLEIVMMRGFNIFYYSDFIFNNSPLGKEFHKLNNRLRSFSEKVLNDRKIEYERKLQNEDARNDGEETTRRKAFLDLLIKMNYENGGTYQFTDKELLDETITLMMAGSDTTASTNCFILTMLGMHQDIQDEVLAEILDVIGPHRQVELSDLPQLRYLERVIKESLRLFPVGAAIARSLDKDIDLGDHVLQKGTSVVFGILRAHTNEKYWPDPYKFDPDRFLPDEIAKRTPGCYIPFSFGPRNCIGLKYAMMAMKALLATVLRKYRIHTSYGSVREIQLKMHSVLRPKNGYKVSFESRP